MGKFISNTSSQRNGTVSYINLDCIESFSSDNEDTKVIMTSGQLVTIAMELNDFKELLKKHGHYFPSVMDQ